DQSQIQLSQQRVIVSNEVHAAYDKAKQMQLKRELFSESIVADAERVRDAILYSYQRGEASLLEVLEAQRTLNEVYTNYYDALSDYAESLITLSTASGQWLLEFHSN
ncbi:MAG: TolC family protein, partial [Balneolales bacterium]|nr:TolC family protein [Balneolales bacterium]